MVNFITHYEGSNFGDAQLMGERNQKSKRHHTAIAAEQSISVHIKHIY